MICRTEGTMVATLNPEQRLAVECMIVKKNELPYVLFGPPGWFQDLILV